MTNYTIIYSFNGTVVWETIRAASVADARRRFRAQNQNFLTVLDIFAA